MSEPESRSAGAAREFDVVVFGATGVTGREVARYLAARAAESGLRWAAAGRDSRRLEHVLAEVGVSPPSLILASVEDPHALAAMAARTRVVLNLVGPYTRFGLPVIEACIAGGANYADLTGELPFVRSVIDRLDAPARAAAVKVVQVCGFEALPVDMLVALAAAAAHDAGEGGLEEVDVLVRVTPPPGPPRASDMLSGGTFQSLVEVAASEQAASITDPALLIGDPVAAREVRARSPIGLAPWRARGGAVVAPMAPAPFINPAVIHRSAVLRGEGHAFRYREGVAFDGGALTLPARWALAGGLSATQLALRALARSPPSLRASVAGALARLGPGSGFGPRGERMERWRWRMDLSARTASGGCREAQLDADGHPGYLATARLLGEAGILLAEDGATPPGAGCLTPAAALGTGSAKRFARAGLRFSA